MLGGGGRPWSRRWGACWGKGEALELGLGAHVAGTLGEEMLVQGKGGQKMLPFLDLPLGRPQGPWGVPVCKE